MLYAEHYEWHAGSAFYPSLFEEAAVMRILARWQSGAGVWAHKVIEAILGAKNRPAHASSGPRERGYLTECRWA